MKSVIFFSVAVLFPFSVFATTPSAQQIIESLIAQSEILIAHNDHIEEMPDVKLSVLLSKIALEGGTVANVIQCVPDKSIYQCDLDFILHPREGQDAGDIASQYVMWFDLTMLDGKIHIMNNTINYHIDQ